MQYYSDEIHSQSWFCVTHNTGFILTRFYRDSSDRFPRGCWRRLARSSVSVAVIVALIIGAIR